MIWGRRINFDIDDAIQKLQRLNLVTQKDTHFVAVSLPDALQSLDQRWDNYFSV